MKPSVGRIVHFVPPSSCVGYQSLTLYPAIITQVNPGHVPVPGDGEARAETVELTTFGPNSLYYQHSVPFSEELKPGHWTWPAKV